MIFAWAAAAFADDFDVTVDPPVAWSAPKPELVRCVPPPPAPAAGDIAGRVVLELRVRRGRASVVAATADPPVASLTPCFEREIAAWTWPTRRAKLELTIDVGPADAATDPAPPLD